VHTLLAVFETYLPPAAFFSASYSVQHVVSAISFGVQPYPGAWQPSLPDNQNQVDLRTARIQVNTAKQGFGSWSAALV